MTRSARLLWGLVAATAGLAALMFFVLRQPPSGATQAPEAALPLKVVTEQAGLTAITAEDLRRAGLDPDQVPPEQWQLRREDRVVPLLPLGQGRGLRLVFYATPSDNLYSPQQVYWLEAAPEGGARPEVRPLDLEPAAAQAVITGTLWVDWQRQYNSRLPEDPEDVRPPHAARPLPNRWVGDALFGGRELSLPFSAPDLAPGPAQLHLRLWANTASPAFNPDHRVKVLLNGQEVAEGVHDGQGFWSIVADVPAGLLQPGENTLLLRAPGDTGARVEQDNPAWMKLTYPRALTAQNGSLELDYRGGGVAVAGLPPRETVLVWDVTEPDRPLHLASEEPLRSDARGRLAFAYPAEAGGEQRLAVAAVSALLRPALIAAPQPESLASLPGADYLLIGPTDLLAAAQPLLERRQAQGLTPLAVNVEAVYEQFGAGRRGPEAIRAFLRHAVETWALPPRFVVLVGDASYDPRGYTGEAARTADRVPTCLVDTYFVGETASDHCYADLDDDLAPELAVGRLPARSADQVQAFAAKLVAYEQTPADADWLRRALLVADKEAEFLNASQRIAEEALQPAGYQTQLLDLADPAYAQPADARQTLLAALDAGVGLINYSGHGSPRWWASELLSSEDALGLRNRERLPLVTAMTCLTGYFHHPTTLSLSEALLWAEGGAAAAFMPSSEGVTVEQLPVALSFYQHLLSGRYTTLGEAIRDTKRDLVQANATNADMIHTFNLLGDPAMRLPFVP
ncbi:MAG: C25 family cysteine peptidase [Caldilineales bacterium]|nr:C25 family cysteine peptidase [Caldilineales bacterium]MDW8317766.1 C25 family cysteine peptidase [Anaerolineae bacterium]